MQRMPQRVPIPPPRGRSRHPAWGRWPRQHREPAVAVRSLQPCKGRPTAGVPGGPVARAGNSGVRALVGGHRRFRPGGQRRGVSNDNGHCRSQRPLLSRIQPLGAVAFPGKTLPDMWLTARRQGNPFGVPRIRHSRESGNPVATIGSFVADLLIFGLLDSGFRRSDG